MSVLLCFGSSGSGVVGSLPVKGPLTPSRSEAVGFKVVIFQCNVRRVCIRVSCVCGVSVDGRLICI
jgi:hypothetical protein